MLEIGTAKAQPGQLTEGWINITELPTGNTEQIPVVIADGTEEGPTLWITGSIHGDEVTGIAAAQDVMSKTLAERLAGTVVCLPNLNPAGLRRSTRTSYYHNDDPNRYFPNLNQTKSRPPRVQELINNRIFDYIEATADALVSLHTAGIDSMPFSIIERVRYGERRSESEAAELMKMVQKLVDAFGLPPIAEFDADVHEEEKLNRSLENSVLNVADVPSFTPELGSHTVVQDQNHEAAITGIYNVMSVLDMLKDDPEPNETAPNPPVDYSVRRAFHPYTNTAGIVRHLVESGDVIETGDPVADIVTPHGNHKTTIHSGHDGYVLARCDGVAVYENDWLLMMGIRDTDNIMIEE